MRLTYTDLKKQYLRNIGKAGTIDTDVLADFDLNLGQRYQLVLARMADYVSQQSYTSTTTAGTQYYGYPPGTQSVDSVKITVGSVNYPITTIYSQHAWDVLNAIQIQPSAIPQFIFPTKDDFGVWPIPQDAYTITFAGFQRDRNLSVEDYTDGTVQMSSGSVNVIGTGTAFTSAMVGRWLEITDPAVPGQGYFYRIATYVSPTSMTTEQPWQADDTLGVAFRIGETPEIPEEGHVILIDGATADFYAGFRDDQTQAVWFNNKFFTGDGNNSSRVMDAEKIAGGLIGLQMRYSSRDKKRIITKQPQPFLPQTKVWATTIS